MLRLVRYGDLVEAGNGQDARPRPGVDEDFVACERLAVDRDLMRAGETGMPAIKGEIGRVVDPVLDAGSERLDDLVLARDDLGHVHLDLAGVNAEFRRASGGLGDAGAGDHRLGGRAAVIDARAAELALLDQSHAPALFGQVGGERDAALTGTDNDRIVGLQPFPSGLGPSARTLQSCEPGLRPALEQIRSAQLKEMLIDDRHYSRSLLDLAGDSWPNQRPERPQVMRRRNLCRAPVENGRNSSVRRPLAQRRTKSASRASGRAGGRGANV